MAPYMQAIVDAQPKFSKQSYSGLMNFDEEAGHAVELLMGNDFTMKTAQQNPRSVQRAVIKVASIGLSLNPALDYAYLVPRDGQICLDISWKGLLKLATDSGAIARGKAETVRENDKFHYKGIYEMPEHIVEHPFCLEKRGKTIGFYCVAIAKDGGYICDFMSKDEVDVIRETSKNSNGPAWKKYYEEMGKKSIIKRAQKQWPKGNDNRLEEAINHLNEHEGLEDTGEKADPDKYSLSGELVEPFFQAFYWHNEGDEVGKPSGNEWLMFEVSDRCTDEQWPMLWDLFKRSDKQLTGKKNKVKAMVSKAQSQYLDLTEAFKQNVSDGREDGMLADLLEDLPTDYAKQKFTEWANEQ